MWVNGLRLNRISVALFHYYFAVEAVIPVVNEIIRIGY
jgi:hypothetical protein